MSSLANVIRLNSQRLTAAQAAYKVTVDSITRYMVTVSKQESPVCINPLPNISDFKKDLLEARKRAENWNNKVLVDLMNVPGYILEDKGQVGQAFDDAITATRQLIANPKDHYAPGNLSKSLNQLKYLFGNESKEVQRTLELLEGTQNDLPQIAAQLNAAAADCTVGVKYDQGQIDQLKMSISDLEQEITRLTKSIIALGGAETALIGLGAAAVSAAGLFGLVTWIVLVPAVAVAGFYIALDGSKIKSCNSKIEELTKNMSDYTLDISTLQVTSGIYTDLAVESEVAKQNLYNVQDAWKILGGEISNEVDEINLALSNSEFSKYNLVCNDLEEAQKEWLAIYSQAESMDVPLGISDADLEFGMSSAQVQSAVEAAKMISIDELFI
ncbi:hypothetical protein C4K38_2117 [Pseudomonas chlororaphis subsp. piscium]|uniref:HBL/NHE enterotoxin family protein n=1 Tax=Pseudomonas chlororaphis TaxID=587753 RepID=UPI00087996C8|nr:HBL/NHE enterotoxin family protein [Pseudomonas chlororaphis]AZC30077.1 hypothetical protein C4K38_2117 [Pseudomonas chlororaphis subsp. piscium]WDG94007.1 HBL/NHE enterotoxin family protein [Pseudomonas chlororaphis]SDT25414.1 haemolytic enterotoxin (HBL) [Pseudomonas chlororaphis]